MMKPHAPRRSHRGFSLVELMVGIVVAMAAVLVITQLFRVSEGQRRATLGADEAQTSGAVSLSMLQRELRQAGQGLMSQQLLLCQLDLGAGGNVPSLAPVTINPAGIPPGDANTDIVMLAYGAGWGSPEGALIAQQQGATTYVVPASLSYQPGDRVVATPATRGTPCNLTLTRVDGDPTPTTVSVATGLAGAANGVLFNLGRQPRFLVYAVRNGRLTVCDQLVQSCSSLDDANWTEIGAHIVSLRAEYARDTTFPRDGLVDSYVTTTPTTPCDMARVVGVRVALVARSPFGEGANVPASPPSWAGAAAITPPGADWQRFRYRTYETTVPLRNTPDPTDPMFASCP